MPRIDIPNVGLVDFPDSMSDAEIALAIEKDILKTPQKPKDGFLSKVADRAKSYLDKSINSDSMIKLGKSKQMSERTTSDINKNNGFERKPFNEISAIEDANFQRRQSQLSKSIQAGNTVEQAANNLLDTESQRNSAESKDFNKKVNTDVNSFYNQDSAKKRIEGEDKSRADALLKEKSEGKSSFTNPLKAAASGANSMVGGLIEASRYDPKQMVLDAAIKAFMPETFEKLEANKDAIQQGLNSGADYWQGEKTLEMREKNKALEEADLSETVALLINNPDLMIDQLAQSAAYLVPGSAAGRGGKVASLAFNTISEAMDSANSARQKAIESGASKLDQDKAAAIAALVAAPMVFVGNKVTGASSIESNFYKKGTPEHGFISSTVREAISGATEEASNQFGQNAGEKATYNQNQSLTEGVGKSALLGGALESMHGAGMSGISSAKNTLLDLATKRDEQQTNADAAMEALPKASTVDDAILLATEAVNTPLDPISDSGLLAKINQSLPSEALPAADILGDDNEINQNDAITNLAANPSESTIDNTGRSMADLPIQSDGGGVGNVATSLASSVKDDLSIGDESGTDSPLAKPERILPRNVGDIVNVGGVDWVKTENGFKRAESKAIEVTGEKIDKEWTAFNPETGSLGIPRESMPQIKAEHRGAMVNFLNARDISHEQETVPSASLKPTQLEFSQSKVDKARNFEGGNRSILVSSDNHVLDGHHQWLAKLEDGQDVDVIRLNAPIKDLIEAVKEFPSASISNGSDTLSAINTPATVDNAESIASKDTQLSVNAENVISKNVRKTSTDNPQFESNRDAIQSLLPKMNWAVIGNKRIDDAEGNQIGRSKYEPMDQDIEQIRQQGTLSYNGMQNAVNKALQGLPLSKAEKHTVDLISNYAESNKEVLLQEPVYDEEQAKLAREEADNFDKSFAEAKANGFIGDVIDFGAYTDEKELKQAISELDDDDLFAGIGKRITTEEFEQWLFAEGVTNESAETESQGNDAGRTQPQDGTNVTSRQAESRTENQESDTPKQSQEIRAIVERIVKRRAAANEIGKQDAFDNYLKLAKDLMNGKAVSANRFKLAIGAFKNDAPLAEEYTKLFNLKSPQAKAEKQAKTSLVDAYKQRIEQANSVESARAILKEINQDTTITEAQAQSLDDLVMDKIDALDNVDDNDITEKRVDETQDNRQTISKMETVDEKDAELIRKYGLPEDTKLSKGLGFNKNRWLAKSGNETSFSYHDKKDGALQDLKSVIENDKQYQKDQKLKHDFKTSAATIIKRGEQPNFSQWKGVLPFIKESDYYVKLSEISNFLSEYLDVPKNNIMKNIGVAASYQTSDGGTKYPVVLFKKLPEVFSENKKEPNADLLGDNTAAKQAVADAERAKDAKRNSGDTNASDFVLTGSNSEADKAAAMGAQDLFTQPQDEVAKAAQVLTEAGVKGKEKLDTIKDVREGKVTAEEVADAYGTKEAEAKIEDVGEKLGGSRKDLARAMAKEYSDDEISSLPLSKIWPITDVDTIENKTAAAIAWTAREMIPSKPRKSYAVKRWVEQVKQLREIGRIVSNAMDRQSSEALQKFKEANLNHMMDKVELLDLIDRNQWKRIGKVESYPNAYRYEGSEKVSVPFVRVDIDGNTNSFNSSKVADIVDKVNERLGVEQEGKRLAFEVRGRTGDYFIMKKGDKNYTKLKTFEKSNDAFAFIRNNYDEVLSAWEATKDKINVKETDTRNKENRPRTGEDYRKGKNVGAEEFANTFGFRGVQFGEWVKQGGKDNDRQGALNAAYDALMDLANIVGVPPKAMSLEGTLGLAFGARGNGKHAAHFEAHSLIINLTKTQGAGTLAHEWFHALDNYFSRKRGGTSLDRESSFITYRPEPLYVHKIHKGVDGVTKAELDRYRANSPKSGYWNSDNWVKDENHPQGVRPEVEEKFADLVEALNTSPMKDRAQRIDGSKTDGYWSRIIELGARSFENYVIHKMQLNGYDNDYLANVVRIENFSRDESRFPYLKEEELAPVAEAFDNLFSEIKTKETDNGNVALFSRSNATKNIPDAIILNELGSAKNNKDYELAKSGDIEAATRLAKVLVTDDVIKQIKSLSENSDYIVGVTSIESSGNNALPEAAAILIADKLGVEYDKNILQSTSPKRTGMDGLDRIFNRPVFNGDVVSGAGYIFVDDTITQGGTFAALSAHISSGGGNVVANIALTGKQYSSKIAQSDEQLASVRQKFGDIENEFKQTTGYDFTGLTASESRYVTLGIPAEKFRSRVIAESQKATSRTNYQASQKDLTNPALSRFNSTGGLSKSDVEKTINSLKAKWNNAPNIIVVNDMNDPAIREAVRDENDRQLSQGAKGQPEGFFDDGKVYIVASEMNSPNDVMRVLFHETLGHAGLRGTYGSELGKVLDQVAMLRNKEMKAKAKQYGLDITNARDKRIIAEEVLAEMAQTNPQAGFVKRAIASIRNFLRSIGIKLELTDNDIVANYLLPARNYVVNGARGNIGDGAALSRTNQTETEAFKKWFGDSKVVDAEGKPLVVYHGTGADFDTFKHSRDIGFHFGTTWQARDITNNTGSIMPVYLKINNPVKTDDIFSQRDGWTFVNGLRDSKVITAKEYQNILDNNVSARFLEAGKLLLIQKGYDGIIYNNKVEGILGDNNNSYIAFNPEQIKSATGNNGNFDPANPNILFNRSESLSVANLFKELTANDDVFQYGKSDAKDLQQVFNDVVPELVKVEKTNINDDDIQDFFNIYPIDNRGNVKRNQLGQIMVYKDGKVEINVAAWDEGFGGSGVYASVGNWAYNNGYVFAGDREGITSTGKLRRLENMISLALKFGTTDHIAPHPDQMRDLGFDWREGDTEYNLGQMLEASYNAIRNGVYVNESRNGYEVTYKSPNALGVAKLDDLVYDFDTQQFKDLSNGTNFTDQDFESLARTKEARATHAGRTTLKRAAIAHTFIREQGTGRQRLLEQLSGFALQRLKDTPLSGIFYSRSNPLGLQRNNAFEPTDDTLINKIVRTLQDKNIDLKQVQQQIKKNVGDIQDRFNAYLQEELYHGRAAKRTKDFVDKELNPLITDMRLRGVEMANFEEYLWMRHAPERNAKMAEINEGNPDGLAGVSTKDAENYLAKLSPVDKRHYEALAKRIDAINAGTRDTWLKYGLESQSTITAMQNEYKYYVPLMREEMDLGFGNGTGQGFSVKGNSTKRATGSKRAVVDIVANIAQAREKAIIRGEKNRVATALIGLAKTSPNDDFWKVDTPPTIKAINKATGMVEDFVDPNYKNRDNVIIARIPDKKGNIQERSVVFNQYDEKAMHIAQSLKNLDVDNMNKVMSIMAIGTRWIASVNTQYNPVFGAFNLWRDAQAVMINLGSTPLAGKQKEVMSHAFSAVKGIYIDIRDARKGEKPNSKWAELFEEYQNEGGQTGYRDQFKDARERSKAIEHALDPDWWMKNKLGKVLTLNGFAKVPYEYALDSKLGAKAIFNWLSDYNETLENAMRLSVYKVAIDNGHSKQQAASMAKNISVNFNRKGSIGREAGALFAFFNASVQGTARMGEALIKDGALSSMGKKVVYGGLLLGAMQALALSAGGFGDDEPPDFVKDRNIVIPIGDGKYLSWALPLGFNVIPSMGRIATEMALGGFKGMGKHGTHILGLLMDSFNPIGSAGMSMQTVTPTVADPFIALTENKDWNGQPIYKEDFNSLDPTPGHTRAKDTATWLSKSLSEAFNYISGGDEDIAGSFSPTPDQIDYLIGQVTGGVGRELSKIEQTATSLLNREESPTHKIPLIGRIYGDTTQPAAQGGKYYKNIMMMNRHDRKIEALIERDGDVDAYIAENPEAALIKQARIIDKFIKKTKKQIKQMKETGDAEEEVKLMNDDITESMRELNELVRSAKEFDYNSTNTTNQ